MSENEFKVSGAELKEKLQKIIAEGNASKVLVWSEDKKKLLEIPLTGGLVLGGALVLLAPFLLAISAIAALATHVTIEVVRNKPGE